MGNARPVADSFRDDLFGRVKTAIVTSATLATDSRFEFLASRLGVDQLDIPPVTESFASPFNYATQAVIAIPTESHAPNADSSGMFAVIQMIGDFAEASDGGLFVCSRASRRERIGARAAGARGFYATGRCSFTEKTAATFCSKSSGSRGEQC